MIQSRLPKWVRGSWSRCISVAYPNPLRGTFSRRTHGAENLVCVDALGDMYLRASSLAMNALARFLGIYGVLRVLRVLIFKSLSSLFPSQVIFNHQPDLTDYSSSTRSPQFFWTLLLLWSRHRSSPALSFGSPKFFSPSPTLHVNNLSRVFLLQLFPISRTVARRQSTIAHATHCCRLLLMLV